MGYRNDKVSDVLAVLAAMRSNFNLTAGSRDTTKLRRDAVREFAESELRRNDRFADEVSAENTIRDALTRRLKLDTSAFDELTDQWLRKKSTDLRDILAMHSKDASQLVEVNNFFEGEQ